MTAHIHVKIKGSLQKIEFLHYLLDQLDRDWPYKPQTSNICKVCGGGIWKSPRLDMDQLKILGKQINSLGTLDGHLSIKVRSWRDGEKCLEVCREKIAKGEWWAEGSILHKERKVGE